MGELDILIDEAKDDILGTLNELRKKIERTMNMNDVLKRGPIDNRPVVLIIGHTDASGGAFNETYKIDEYDFNSALVNLVRDRLLEVGFKRDVIIQERIKLSSLPKQINDLNPLFAISFHANAFNTRATGTEMLYYEESVQSKTLAFVLQEEIYNALGLHDRGIKSKNERDRGGYLLKGVMCPIVIAEPFFIDNDDDLRAARNSHGDLKQAYVNAIIRFNSIMENDYA